MILFIQLMLCSSNSRLKTSPTIFNIGFNNYCMQLLLITVINDCNDFDQWY